MEEDKGLITLQKSLELLQNENNELKKENDILMEFIQFNKTSNQESIKKCKELIIELEEKKRELLIAVNSIKLKEFELKKHCKDIEQLKSKYEEDFKHFSNQLKEEIKQIIKLDN